LARQNVSATQKGTDFEAYVRSLYEGLGFKVDTNVKLVGQQVDLVVRKAIAGIGEIRFLIECKFLTSGNLSNQEVYNFISFAQSAKDSLGLTGAVLVCSRDFSADAKTAAVSHKFVQLKRVVDLERDLFDVSDILRHKIQQFQNQDVFAQYVPLSGRLAAGGKNNLGIQDVLSYLETWTSKEQGGLVTVLGDFGSGKTTLLQRLEYKMAQIAILSHESPRIPIFVTLR
jgi:hypothetical protein